VMTIFGVCATTAPDKTAARSATRIRGEFMLVLRRKRDRPFGA
jgi:hypothetical protein